VGTRCFSSSVQLSTRLIWGRRRAHLALSVLSDADDSTIRREVSMDGSDTPKPRDTATGGVKLKRGCVVTVTLIRRPGPGMNKSSFTGPASRAAVRLVGDIDSSGAATGSIAFANPKSRTFA
jgi:hypothetical protein